MANLKIEGWLNIPEEPLPSLFDAEEFMSFEIKINLYDMIKQDVINNIQNEGAFFLYKTNILEEMESDTCQNFFENYLGARILDLLDRDALPIVQVKLEHLPDYWYQVEVALNIEEEYGKYKLRTQFK